MRIPGWLGELHSQWLKARGASITPRSKPFTRDWDEVLDRAGIRGFEEITTAVREAEKLEQEGKVILRRQPGRRHRILRIVLPLEAEPWLSACFNTALPGTIREESLTIVREMRESSHPVYPSAWADWLNRVETAFTAGKSLRPLSWRYPGRLKKLLEITFYLSTKDWREGVFIREASVGLNGFSKELEKYSRATEACLTAMLRQKMTLGMLGITTDLIRIELAGDLTLYFEDGTKQTINALDGGYQLTTDLERATHATTRAKRILTVENVKTTFRRLAELNTDRETLLIASSFPGKGLARLIRLLPDDLPVFHFGDTDPAGYMIFSKIRTAIGRDLFPFLMKFRPGIPPVPLTEYDRRILPGLLTDPNLAILRQELLSIQAEDDKGRFEQESLGTPDLPKWPFYSHCASRP